MLKVYDENTPERQLPMSIQTMGTPEDVRAWIELYKETAGELGYDPNGEHGFRERQEIGLVVCRKLFQV